MRVKTNVFIIKTLLTVTRFHSAGCTVLYINFATIIIRTKHMLVGHKYSMMRLY